VLSFSRPRSAQKSPILPSRGGIPVRVTIFLIYTWRFTSLTHIHASQISAHTIATGTPQSRAHHDTIMSDDPRKRSRFDQAEPESRRNTSRFDRRSRSPSNRTPDAGRSRSPTTGSSVVASDAAAAAAAAAARINANFQHKRGIQHVDVPPVTSSPGLNPAGAQSPSGEGLQKEIYQQDGDFIKDIEVNDLRNRYTLTKGATQKMVNILLS